MSGSGRDLGHERHAAFYLRTLRPTAIKEVALFRGVHPMMGERLHLWRLQNFKIERLPSVEDVYLLHAVANENPKR